MMQEKLADMFKFTPDKVKWRAWLAELFGTLMFVFNGSLAVVATSLAFENDISSYNQAAAGILVALAHGLTLLVVVHSMGPISGAHINPAVSFAAFITGNMDVYNFIAYVLSQLIGSTFGALLVWAGDPDGHAKYGGYLGIFQIHQARVGNGFIIELVLTFILVTAIFGAAIKPQHIKNHTEIKEVTGIVAMLPIGLAVGADALAGGLVTGASMNPARAFGPTLVANAWKDTSWIYFVAPFVGGGIAGLLYEFVLTPPVKETDYDHIN